MIQVFLITHKRPEWCLFILKQLAKDRHKKRVTIFHDKCDSDYSEVIKFCKDNNWEYFKTKGFGKWRFWEMLNVAYSYFRGKDYKYFLQIPDDVVLVQGFFGRIKKHMTDNYEIINPFTFNVHKKRFVDADQDEHVYYNNWADNCFFTTKKVMDKMFINMPKNTKRKNNTLGTGTGGSFSFTYQKIFNKRIKQTKYALIYHRGGYGKTVMHTSEFWNKKHNKDILNRYTFDWDSLLTKEDWRYIDSLNLEATSLENMVRGKSVAFVGMAPSIKGKGLGKEIDSHDIVYRTNMYKVPKHLQNDYGKKTTVVSMLQQYMNLIPDYIDNGLKYIVTFKELSEYNMNVNYRVLTEEYRREVAAEMNKNVTDKIVWPTSGLLAYFLCQGCKSFTYYGITGYQDKDGNVQNHNGQNNYIKEYTDFWGDRKSQLLSRDMVNDHYHNFKGHNQYIRYLVRRKKIKLDKYSHEYFRSNSRKRKKHTV